MSNAKKICPCLQVNHGAKGILGETFVPTRGVSGSAIMTGMEAIRGTQEDCKFFGGKSSPSLSVLTVDNLHYRKFDRSLKTSIVQFCVRWFPPPLYRTTVDGKVTDPSN